MIKKLLFLKLDKSLNFKGDYIMEKEYISIFKPQRARRLLKMNNQIVDIKLDKEEPEKEKSIFIFKNTEKLQEDIEILVKQGI